MQKSRTVSLTNRVLENRGVNRWRKREALKQLAAMGLISTSNEGHHATMVSWVIDPLG
jgi:DNA-binding FadR family transcriptional regulator